MNRIGFLGLLGLVLAGYPATAQAADKGQIIYAAGNCFIIQTEKGATLFERSGGRSPKVNDAVAGVLNDFGYQQLHDASGKELMVGFVQEHGVKKDQNIESFKKSCR
jgi:hypothetical protein